MCCLYGFVDVWVCEEANTMAAGCVMACVCWRVVQVAAAPLLVAMCAHFDHAAVPQLRVCETSGDTIKQADEPALLRQP